MTEEERRRPFLTKRLKLALVGAVAVLAVGAPFWGPLLLRRMDFFRVRTIEIVGARYIAVNDILDRMRVDTSASVWEPTGPIARRVAAHPQVHTVDVRRKLPGTLVVEISENLPVALVATPRGFRAYDARGVALPLDPARTPIDAPILTQRDTGLLRLLGVVRIAMPRMYERVSEVRRVGTDELLFRLSSVPVRAMWDVSVERLAEIEPVEDDLARRQLRALEIDLRYRDQVIARLP